MRNQQNWPPVWLWTGRGENRSPRGEVGILSEVYVCITRPDAPKSVRRLNRVYLFMEYQGGHYLGVLSFEDASLCRKIGKILEAQCGRSMEEIGFVDCLFLSPSYFN